MTTTTADKGELLPLPENLRADISGLVLAAIDGEAEQMEVLQAIKAEITAYALANMNRRPTCEQQRTTNEGQEGRYIEGVNAPRLTLALSLMGCAATESMEALCAPDVMANHINRLTSAIARHLSKKQEKA